MILNIDTSSIKPIDWNTMVAPLIKYDKDYDLYLEKLEKIEEDYGNLKLPLSSIYNETINRFNDLANLAYEAFYTQGLNNRTGRALFEVSKMAKRELKPIKLGIEAYNKLVDKLNSLGTDAIYDTLNVDDFILGLTPERNYASRKDILSTSASVLKGLLNLKNDPNFVRLYQSKQDAALGYMMMNRDSKISQEEILSAALLDYKLINPEVATSLEKAMLNIYNSFSWDGISELSTNKIWLSIQQSALAALEDNKPEIMKDLDWHDSMEWERFNMAKESHQWEEDDRPAKKEAAEQKAKKAELAKQREEIQAKINANNLKMRLAANNPPAHWYTAGSTYTTLKEHWWVFDTKLSRWEEHSKEVNKDAKSISANPTPKPKGSLNLTDKEVSIVLNASTPEDGGGDSVDDPDEN